MNSDEIKIISFLDDLLRNTSISKLIDLEIVKARKALENSNSSSITETLPLSVFENKLSKDINLCRLFILKANLKSKIERHRNSHQRTFTCFGEGDTRILENNIWKSNISKSLGASIDNRWLSVPENTWHQPIALLNDWITITFHTASESEIIDEYMD